MALGLRHPFLKMTDTTSTLAYRARSTAGLAIQNLAIQDWVAVAFHAYMWTRVTLAPDSPNAALGRQYAATLLVITLCSLVLSRGEVIGSEKIRALVYRLGLFVPVVLSYFELRWILPALQLDLVDHQLHMIDLGLFGITPSVWMAQFNQKTIVEWVSFFYYGYFYLLVLMLIPQLFVERGRRLIELMAGALLVCTLGHVGYTLVPGAGPYATLEFAEPLAGGFWWSLVELTVSKAGAHLDIFPSLHTAYPTYFALHAFANRDRGAFKWLWPWMFFFAFNIIIATMFLRWHWGIDVLAGLALAWAARQLAVAIANREEYRGTPLDSRQQAWEPLFEYQRH